MADRLVHGMGCPECNGPHTSHEGNVLGHAVGCSLKPENIISKYREALKQILHRAERGSVIADTARRALLAQSSEASTRTRNDSRGSG